MTMTSASLLGRAHDDGVDERDPAERPRRRTFTVEYKERILAEYDSLAVAFMGALAVGASAQERWEPLGDKPVDFARDRDVIEVGAREGLAPKGKPRRSPEAVELEKLRRRTAQLEAELARTKTALEITGKVHALLEQLSESAAPETKPKP